MTWSKEALEALERSKGVQVIPNKPQRQVLKALKAFKLGGDTRLLKAECERGNHYALAKLENLGLEYVGGIIRRKQEETRAHEVLTCDMEKDCSEPVAMIDQKGYIYCEAHGFVRRDWMPCRRLRGWELRRLERGKPLTHY